MLQYVVYTRVSTKEQGRSGHGLDAQERDVGIFLDCFSDVPFEVIGRYCDVQSGGVNDRPELEKALALMRKTGADLLVAKLDRLSRKVSFIAKLTDDPKVRLRVASMPNADKFQLHIYAALAEQERTFISERTKAALRSAKERGQKLGGLRDATMARNVAVQAQARQNAEQAWLLVGPRIEAGESLSSIAAVLNKVGAPTARGGQWTAKQVSRIAERMQG